VARTYRTVWVVEAFNPFTSSFRYKSSYKKDAQNAFLYNYRKLTERIEPEDYFRDRVRHTCLQRPHYLSGWEDKVPSALHDVWCEHRNRRK
jgi:hypothetical protein